MPLGACHIGPRAVPAHGDPRRLAANRQRGGGRHRAKIDDGQIVARLIRNEGLVGAGRANEQRREKHDRESAKTHSRSTRAFSAARPFLNRLGHRLDRYFVGILLGRIAAGKGAVKAAFPFDDGAAGGRGRDF